MGIKFANQAASTLASGITAAATSITLATGQGALFPAVSAGSGDYFLVTLSNASGYEIAMCVARAGDVLTVFRGIEGTTAQAFNAGDACENRLTAGMMTDLSGVFPSWRNRIRNGKGVICQRGSVAFAAGTSGYSVDGWLYGASQGAVTVSQNAASLLSTDFQYNIRVTVNTAFATAPAAGDYAQLQQPIEGFLVRDLIGNPIGIRFEVQSPKAGQHYFNISNGPGDHSYVVPYTVTAANTPQLITASIPGGLITTGTWNWTNGLGLYLRFPLLGGTTFQTGSLNTWVAGNVICGSGQQNLLDTAGNVFAITGVQLERGNVSSYEHLDPVSELQRQQRYYWQMRRGWGVIGSTAAVWRMGAHCPVQMRAAPTLSLVGGPPIQAGNLSTTSLTSVGTNYSTVDAVEFDGGINTVGGTNIPAVMLAGSSGAYVGVSAEL